MFAAVTLLRIIKDFHLVQLLLGEKWIKEVLPMRSSAVTPTTISITSLESGDSLYKQYFSLNYLSLILTLCVS